ncbi:unnamed protein product [Pleuronectes platessa]|uniref:Uncharacterized protein n=1 Tax=Pleuronectes platessa TaxID=8262 RepID=A0A9N7TJG1_PLEPL|nr:unnamed protein product [Pleuronectes platessa]
METFILLPARCFKISAPTRTSGAAGDDHKSVDLIVLINTRTLESLHIFAAGYKHMSSNYTLVRPNTNSILGPVVVGIFPYELGLPFKKPATNQEIMELQAEGRERARILETVFLRQ